MKKLIMFCLVSIFYLNGTAFGAFNFIDNGNGTVTDARTNLVWLKNADPCGYKTWDDAITYCSSLASGMAGLTDGSVAGDWRLPSVQELEGIGTDPPTTYCLDGSCNYPSVPWTIPGAPFTNVQSLTYWSGTSYASNPACAWLVSFFDDYVGYGSKGYNGFHVWPVREPITTTTTIQPTTTTTICDGDYWKYLYEQTKAELDACQNPTTTTALPTNIKLSVLDAVPSNEQVLLRWKTETETGNAGFNVWRADNFVKVNNAVIPALGSPVSGSEYDFVDQWVLNGKRYFYLLEDIDNDGISTFHGPVKAVPRWWHGVRR